MMMKDYITHYIYRFVCANIETPRFSNYSAGGRFGNKKPLLNGATIMQYAKSGVSVIYWPFDLLLVLEIKPAEE